MKVTSLVPHFGSYGSAGPLQLFPCLEVLAPDAEVLAPDGKVLAIISSFLKIYSPVLMKSSQNYGFIYTTGCHEATTEHNKHELIANSL